MSEVIASTLIGFIFIGTFFITSLFLGAIITDYFGVNEEESVVNSFFLGVIGMGLMVLFLFLCYYVGFGLLSL